MTERLSAGGSEALDPAEQEVHDGVQPTRSRRSDFYDPDWRKARLLDDMKITIEGFEGEPMNDIRLPIEEHGE